MKKKIIAYLAILTVILTSFIPVWADVQDYRNVPFTDANDKPVSKPTAQFSITHNGTTYKSPIGTDINSNLTIIKANVGDTITVADLSHSNRGKPIKAWDFQYTRPDGSNQFIDTQAFQKSYNLDVAGTYTFSLCVRDTIEDEAWTNYWGNWSDNGNHRVIGNNPGRDAGDPSDDFMGYWYFTRIVVIVEKSPPTADFTIEYQGSDVTDNKTSPATVDLTDKALVLKDKSTPFSTAEPITGRKWYYWDTSSGWTEIAGSANKTTVNIADMDTILSGSGVNKGFKLVCTSSTGGTAYKEHTGYFKKAISTAYGYIVYYRNVDTNLDISTPKVVEGLTAGTYIEMAVTAPANATLVTPSPATIVLSPASPSAEYAFYYKFTIPPEPPSSNPPTAILEAPVQVMAGQPVKVDGGKSWSNNPGGYIADYYFEYEGANLISDNNSNVRIWYPNTGTYEIYLQVEDEGGKHDSMVKEIKVIPPTPTAVIGVSGKLKENRKVTLDASGSTSTEYYPIDHTKTKWEVTPGSGSSTVTTANLLRNGDAEKGGYSVPLAEWNMWASDPLATTFTKRTGDVWAINGTSFEIATQPNQNYAGVYYQDIPGMGGVNYAFTGKMGTHRCNGYAYVQAYDSAWNSLGVYVSNVVYNNSAVQNLSINFTAPANTKILRVHLVKAESVINTTGWWDHMFADDLVLTGIFPLINYSGGLTGNATKDILIKKAGTYKTKLTVTNTYGLWASTEQTITIAQDLPPVAQIWLPTADGVKYKIYRDPNNYNLAVAEAYNTSYSPDGDTINKAVGLYCYDSDNDGSYTDEQWYYSTDGTAWLSTGMNHVNTVDYFNINNIATPNVQKFTHKTTEVGNFWFAIGVMEAIPAEETIPEFINENDYMRDDSY